MIEIISMAKFLIIVYFFVLKYEKQTLCYIHTKSEGNKHFFSLIYFVGVPAFIAPTLKITWDWEVDAPVITWYE